MWHLVAFAAGAHLHSSLSCLLRLRGESTVYRWLSRNLLDGTAVECAIGPLLKNPHLSRPLLLCNSSPNSQCECIVTFWSVRRDWNDIPCSCAVVTCLIFGQRRFLIELYKERIVIGISQNVECYYLKYKLQAGGRMSEEPNARSIFLNTSGHNGPVSIAECYLLTRRVGRGF